MNPHTVETEPPAVDWRCPMTSSIDPKTTRELTEKRRSFDPDTEAVFQVFSRAVFADGALSIKTKQLIAVAVAHVTQCP